MFVSKQDTIARFALATKYARLVSVAFAHMSRKVPVLSWKDGLGKVTVINRAVVCNEVSVNFPSPVALLKVYSLSV